MKTPSLRNSTNKPLSILSVACYRERTGHSIRIYLKEALNQEPRVEVMILFEVRHFLFSENAYLFRKFQAIFVQKTCTQVPGLGVELKKVKNKSINP